MITPVKYIGRYEPDTMPPCKASGKTEFLLKQVHSPCSTDGYDPWDHCAELELSVPGDAFSVTASLGIFNACKGQLSS